MSFRRFVPSGGALYPSEIYVYLKLADMPSGIYHYDAAHHRLVLLRDGCFDAYLNRALGNRCDVTACFGTVFVSTVFWKNFFKYNNFAYRLQGLDAGAAIGQLLEAAKRFGYETTVFFQFLDRAVNHLLGLYGEEESVYAVIPLSVHDAAAWFGAGGDGRASCETAAELCGQLEPVRHNHFIRSKRVLEYPMLVRMNEASLQESSESFRRIGCGENSGDGTTAIRLPGAERLTYDLVSVSGRRTSPGTDFVMGKVGLKQLSQLLHEATTSFMYLSDLDGPKIHCGCSDAGGRTAARVAIYGCFHHVEDIPDGAYRYDSAAHTLRLLRPGDHRMLLMEGTPPENVNMHQVPVCLHVAGDQDHLRTSLGYRGYRIQQMEAGMLVQRLLLAASAIGLAGHPLLAFDAKACDGLYQMASAESTSLIQVAVGPYRHRPRLEGGLHA